MKKLLKHMHLFHLIFLILSGVILVSALPFKTQYNTVAVYGVLDSEGNKIVSEEMTNAIGQDQKLLYEYYRDILGDNFTKHANDVVKFENALNILNNVLFAFGILMVVSVLLLFFFQNHKRRIYYASNVVISLFVAIATAVGGVMLIVNFINVMSMLLKNYTLFNNVAILQNSSIRTEAFQAAQTAGSAGAAQAAMNKYFYVNNMTLIIYMIGAIVVILYSFFMFVLTVAKFRRTKERRQEIISKAVENND